MKTKTKLSTYEATGIAEGWIPAESKEQLVQAWQQLHDTGLAYELQGWFGRTAQNLIAEGIIKTDQK